jgi:hypothetical protein
MNKSLMSALVLLLTSVSASADDGFAPSQEFALTMENLGLRWTQDADQISDMWTSPNSGNAMRLFGTVNVGSRQHQVQVAWDQSGMTGPWDTFRSRDSVGDQVYVEYQYNFTH